MRFREAQSRMRRADELKRAARIALRQRYRMVANILRRMAEDLEGRVPRKMRGVWRG